MGLLLDKLKQIELAGPPCAATNYNSTFFTNGNNSSDYEEDRKKYQTGVKFPDLETIPSELSLQILKYLNATDLCLAACVWSSLANDDVLWQGLCRSTWGYASVYNKMIANDRAGVNSNQSRAIEKLNFRKIFMHLDEATLTFNSDWKKFVCLDF